MASYWQIQPLAGHLRAFLLTFFCLECVTRKYPRDPEAAFASARDAANQYGLDQKGKHGMEFINEMMTQPRVQDTDDEQESE